MLFFCFDKTAIVFLIPQNKTSLHPSLLKSAVLKTVLYQSCFFKILHCHNWKIFFCLFYWTNKKLIPFGIEHWEVWQDNPSHKTISFEQTHQIRVSDILHACLTGLLGFINLKQFSNNSKLLLYSTLTHKNLIG